MQQALSTNERQFILQCLNGGKGKPQHSSSSSSDKQSSSSAQRLDGRSQFQCRRTKFSFDRSDNECQCEVQFGRTRVLSVVSGSVAVPYDDRPTEGFVNVFVRLSPMADPSGNGEDGNSSAFSGQTTEIRSILEGLLKDGNAMDFEALCIVAGEKVWSIRIDVCILDNAGNLIDACAVAMMAALLYFRKSAVEVQEGNEVRLLASHESEPTPLSIHHIPLSSTLLVYNGGESAILDPTDREELALDCRITYSFNIHRELCMLQKLGGVAMSQESILQFARLAFANVQKRIEELKTAVEKAVADADDRRWEVRTTTMEDLPESSIFKRPQGAPSTGAQPFRSAEMPDEVRSIVEGSTVQ